MPKYGKCLYEDKGYMAADKMAIDTTGYKEEASRYQTIAEQLKNGILSHLWNKDNYLQKSIKDSSFCFMSNAMALSVGLLPNELANKAVSACLAKP